MMAMACNERPTRCHAAVTRQVHARMTPAASLRLRFHHAVTQRSLQHRRRQPGQLEIRHDY